MSRKNSRAYKREQRLKEARADFSGNRGYRPIYAQYLNWLAASDIPVWLVAEPELRKLPHTSKEDAFVERAQIAEIVAPHLAARTPGSVHRRHALGSLPKPGSTPGD